MVIFDLRDERMILS